MSDYTVADVPLGYAPVPPELVMYQDEQGKALGGTEIRLWSMLAMHRNMKTQRTKAGTVRMADMLGVDRTTAQRAANKLIRAGFLIHKPRQRDRETGEFTPAEFVLAVGGKPMGVGIFTYEEEDGASAHTGDAGHDASAHQPTRHPRTSHEAHHDASHDASAQPKPPINAPAERTEKEDGKEEFSPRGASAPREAKSTTPAKAMTSLTIERTLEVGFDAAPHQRSNWGNGWARFVYVAEGQEPPSAERQFAVLQEIVGAASGKGGKARYFLSVDDAVKRVEGKGGALFSVPASKGADAEYYTDPDTGQVKKKKDYSHLFGESA